MLKTITSVANTVGSLEYKGLWNAATNTPTLVSSVGTQGDYYVVSVAGTTNLDGVTTWDEGDWAIFNGSVWQLFQGGQDGVFATLTVSGEIAANGGIALGDNDKATFGTSDDLQIYHDGSNSYIKDAGTGGLRLLADADTAIRAADNATARAIFGGDVKLYYSGNQKLSTTATGIDISGTATMDGLTVDTSATGGFKVEDRGAEGAGVKVTAYQGTTNSNVRQLDVDAYQLTVSTGSVTGATVTDRLLIADNGDISFYEDTGTTPKFFWDASAESLGIGNSSPTSALHITATHPTVYLETSGGGATDAAYLQKYSNDVYLYNKESAGNLYLGTNNTTKVTLDSSGSLLVGGTSKTSTPSLDNGVYLQSQTNGDVLGYSLYSNEGTNNRRAAFFLDDTNGVYGFDSSAASGVPDFVIRRASSEQMRLTSTGLGIGTSSPTYALDLIGGGDYRTLRIGNISATGVKRQAIAARHYTSTEEDVCLIGMFGDATTTTIAIGGGFGATGGFNSATKLEFHTAANNTTTATSAAMTLDYSGNLLVGKTTSNTATVGIELRASNLLNVTSSGAQALQLNRLSSDGEIAKFLKDGTAVGSIGVASNDLNINGGANHSGIRFQATGLYPLENGTASSGEIDLGAAGSKFKDLYLSGGVYLGGTGAANLLDDYESGTWTPVYTADSGAATHNVQTGSYVKVGKLVTVIGELQASRNTLSGAVTITGLPFASSGNGGGFNPTFTIRFASDMPNLKGYTSASSIVLKKQATSSTNSVDVIETDLSNTATNYNYLYFTATYMTA